MNAHRAPACCSPTLVRCGGVGRARGRGRHARLLGYVAAMLIVPSALGTISEYFPSNCYEVGGGNMGPLYLKCAGCQYVEAFTCLETLRSNASGNVPAGCGINSLTVQPEPACCPVFQDPSNHRSLDSSTSAYPDALRCLEDNDCAGDNLHTSLVGECLFNQCTEQYACVAAYSGSRRRAPASSVLGLSVALALALRLSRV